MEQEWHTVDTYAGYLVQQLGDGNEGRLVKPETGSVALKYEIGGKGNGRI